MTAAEKKIILEHGSDYLLQLKIKADDGLNDRDVSGWTWVIKIYNASTAVLASTITGQVPDYVGTVDVPNPAENGLIDILIDSASIDSLPTLVQQVTDPFATEYNYYYTLTITDNPVATSDNRRDMRLLRGKLAVRL